MFNFSRSQIRHYGVAVLSVALALMLMLILDPWLKMFQSPFLLFFGAVMISAWYGGVRAGVLATVLSIIISRYFFMPPLHTLAVLTPPEIVRLMLFGVEGILFSALCGILRRKNKQLDASGKSLQTANQKNILILESITDGFYTLDHQWRFTYVNQRGEELLGRSRTELLGYSIWEVFPEAVKSLTYLQFHYAYQNQTPVTFETIRSDNSGQWYEVRAYPSSEGLVVYLQDITDRKQAADRLQESELRFRQLADNIYEVFWVSVPQPYKILYVSPAYEIIWGQSCQRLYDQPDSWKEAVHPEDLAGVEAATQKLRQGEKNFNQEYRIIRPDGSLRWIWARSFAIRNEAGATHRIVGIAEDITERKQTEQALKSSEERLQLAQKIGKIGTCEWNLQTHKVVWTEEMEILFGMAPGSFDGRYESWLQALHPDDRDQAHQAAMSSATEGKDFDTEFRTFLPDGSLHWLLAKAKAFKDENGKPERVIGVNMDITELKQAQEAIREQEERLRLAVEGADLGMWDYDLCTGRLVWSERCKAMFDIAPDTDISYDIFLAAVHPEDRERVNQAVQCAIANQENYDVEIRLLWSDGSLHWIRSIGHAYYNEQGEPIRMAGVTLDITCRKQAEAALRKSEERFRIAQELSLDAFTVLRTVRNQAGEIVDFEWTYVNPTAARIIRRAVEDLIGQRLLEVLPGNKANSELFDRYVRVVETGEPHDIEVHYESEGIGGWFRNMAVKLDDGVAISFSDITNRKRDEQEREKLLASEQAAREMAEAANRVKDEFLAVLSHELRTPLNPILGWSKMLRSRKFDEKTMTKAMETIERNARLQTQLIDDLLDVSRILRGKLTLNVAPVSLETIIHGALETVRLAAEAKSIQIKTLLAPDVGFVAGDPSRLQQVIWNLLSNAVKFTPEGGQVEVKLEHINHQAQIRVTDTGIGIDPEFVPYVFDYFRQADSTTTRKFGGLGLGLGIARHIIELHGGLIAASSAGEGQGATFVVRLPLMRVNPDLHQGNPASEISLNLEGVKALVVDDEPDARELIAFILEQSRAKVWQFASAIEALGKFTELKPDLLISDIGMPEIDGYTLMQEIRNLPPEKGGDVLAIALTAYARDDDRNRALQAGFQRHIPKPIEPEMLLDVVAGLLKDNHGGYW